MRSLHRYRFNLHKELQENPTKLVVKFVCGAIFDMAFRAAQAHVCSSLCWSSTGVVWEEPALLPLWFLLFHGSNW